MLAVGYYGLILIMKICRVCKLEKPLTSFYADKNSKDGRRSDCSTCKDASTSKWRKDNAEYYNRTMREYQAANPLQRDDCDLRRKYGVSRLWFDETLVAQDHKCAICLKPNTATKRRLAVDHHHESGKVRGILCYNCNRLLHAFDNKDLYEKILKYLAFHADPDNIKGET